LALCSGLYIIFFELQGSKAEFKNKVRIGKKGRGVPSERPGEDMLSDNYKQKRKF